MTPRELAQHLQSFAQGDETHRRELVEELYDAVAGRNGRKMLQLSVELARMADDGALNAFDALMGMLTCEPVTLAGYETAGWRAYTLTTLFERPAGAVISQVANEEDLAQRVSEATGVPLDHIRVVPTHLQTHDAFQLPPSEVFHFCQELKTALEVETILGPNATQERVAQHLAPILALDAVNGWRTEEAQPVNDEAIFLVLIRGDAMGPHGTNPEHRIQFEARYVMDGGDADPLNIHHQVLNFSTPWEAFRGSLHSAQAFSVCRLLAHAAADRQVDPSTLQMSVAFVENADGADSMTARVAIFHPHAGLLSGVVEHNLAEPDQYAHVLRRMAQTLGLGKVAVSDAAFVSKEADAGDTYRFLVPGKGWLQALETFIAFPAN